MRVFAVLHRSLRLLVGLAVLAAIGAALLWAIRTRPQDLPGTPLDLGQPIGLFTGRKLSGLTQDRAQCLALLDQAGIEYRALDPHGEGQCRADDQVRLSRAPPVGIALAPGDVAPSCPVVAALAMWEWNVVQPEALRLLGSKVARIEHFGSYSCRRISGRGAWSEHATADALDVAAFVLEDGRRVSVAGDWSSGNEEAAFLRAVRDGACDLYATVLSPDYNAAHADHIHLDQAYRGAMGWRGCF